MTRRCESHYKVGDKVYRCRLSGNGHHQKFHKTWDSTGTLIYWAPKAALKRADWPKPRVWGCK